MEIFTKKKIISDLQNLGLKKGDIIHVKVSMRSVGKLENGANTLLEALLETIGEEGTLVADAFVNVYPLPLNSLQKLDIADDNTPSNAGVFVNEMIKHPKMFRSKHPIQKFVAIGNFAEKICAQHLPNSGGYDLLKNIINLNSKNLNIGENIIGVGTTHLAIEYLNFKRKQLNLGRLYRTEKGDIELAKVNWNGGCSNGFVNFLPYYENNKAIISKGKLGRTQAILTDMKKTLEIEIQELKNNPSLFFCSNPACYSCKMTWEHSEKNKIKFGFNWLRKNFKNLSFKRILSIFKIVK
ncbi:MAG: AAC(3) family N-acetyltransferase [Bacteroidales bacterium]|jgi:aminoglycoside 3-N-acetyltransferase